MLEKIQRKIEQTPPIKPESLLYVGKIVDLYVETFERMRRLTRKQISQKTSPEKSFGILQNLTNILLQTNRDQILLIKKSIGQNPNLWIKDGRYHEYLFKYKDRPAIRLGKSTNYQDYLGEDGIDCLSFSIRGFDGLISFSAEVLDSGSRRFTLDSINLILSQQTYQNITFIIERSKEGIYTNSSRIFRPVKKWSLPPELKDSFCISLPYSSSDLVPSDQNRNGHKG